MATINDFKFPTDDNGPRAIIGGDMAGFEGALWVAYIPFTRIPSSLDDIVMEFT